MNGEPVSGHYYDPESERPIWLYVRQKPKGLEGNRPWYCINYGWAIGMAMGWECPEWKEWVPYTGQSDRLMDLKVKAMVAAAQIGHYPERRSWWRFW